MFFLKNNKLYTDASIRSYIGLGCYMQNYCFLSMSISGKKDINRAELAAIYIGLLYAPKTYLNIYSDSATALDLIADKYQHQKYNALVFAIKNITLVKYNGFVQYYKVKGHSGVEGNEIANLLAREAALKKPQ